MISPTMIHTEVEEPMRNSRREYLHWALVVVIVSIFVAVVFFWTPPRSQDCERVEIHAETGKTNAMVCK